MVECLHRKQDLKGVCPSQGNFFSWNNNISFCLKYFSLIAISLIKIEENINLYLKASLWG